MTKIGRKKLLRLLGNFCQDCYILKSESKLYLHHIHHNGKQDRKEHTDQISFYSNHLFNAKAELRMLCPSCHSVEHRGSR